MSDEEPALPLPAVVRAMLQPFVEVMNERPPKGVSQRIVEPTFLQPHLRPTADQLQAIGRVTTAWSLVERVLGMVLSRLAMAPEYPATAITKDLGLDYQTKAIRTLIALHQERYRKQVIPSDTLEVLTNMLKELSKLRQERNIVVHTVWISSIPGTTLHSLRARPVTGSASASKPSEERTLDQINKLADDIQALADAMFIVVQFLPALDEGLIAKSLALNPGHLPR
ncbi:hypothetical protein [Mesorhizobium sp. M0036]|uniref:hypothetical protein n=1 Tax=Mesorhizobium sp. M0036 TaxID=2956853 RepID=UPI0033388804